MTRKNTDFEGLSAHTLKEYEKLSRQLENLPLLAQGSVFEINPPTDAPRARTRYMWTRKVKAKTITKALNKEQYELLKTAIEANRKAEAALKRMREISHEAILEERKIKVKRRYGKSS
jgi:hypothetical protein